MIRRNANGSVIQLGKQGENLALEIAFPDSTMWGTYYGGDGKYILMHQRPGEEAVYQCGLYMDNGIPVWRITSADTAIASSHEKTGRAELRYLIGDTIVKSRVYRTLIAPSLTGTDSEPPDPAGKAWYEKIESEIGDLSKLETDEKDSLVGAINEAAKSGLPEISEATKDMALYNDGEKAEWKEVVNIIPDWQQNNPQANDYIKNRCGGYDVVKTEQINLSFNQPRTFSKEDGDVDFYSPESSLSVWMAYESDVILSPEELLSATINGVGIPTSNLKIFKPSDDFYYFNSHEITRGTFGTYPPLMAVVTKQTTMWGYTFDKLGLYSCRAKHLSRDVEYVTSIEYVHSTCENVKIPEKYLDIENLKSLCVTITQNDDDTYSSDHTYAEIKAAYDAGKYVYAVYNGTIVPLSSVAGDNVLFAFSVLFPDQPPYAEAGGILRYAIQIVISSEDTVHVGEPDNPEVYAIPQQLVILVTESDDGHYSSSVTLEAMVNMISNSMDVSEHSGMPNLVAVLDNEIYRLTYIAPIMDSVVFTCEGEVTKILTCTAGDDDTWTYKEVAGSSDTFPCVITSNADGTYSCDKTYDEIMAAVNAGKVPYIKWNDPSTTYGPRDVICWYNQWTNLPGAPYAIQFSATIDGFKYMFVITHGNEVSFTSGSLTISNDGGTYPSNYGLVRRPGDEDTEKFLRGDGTWADVPSGDYVLTDEDKTEIAAEVIAGGVEAELGEEPLPAPASASVGQIVKVKAVDENGKVTQTEAADAEPGSDASLGITGAAVGQIAKITAVDADGKPTAWTPVDMPSSGGTGGIPNSALICDVTLAEAAQAVSQTLEHNFYALHCIVNCGTNGVALLVDEEGTTKSGFINMLLDTVAQSDLSKLCGAINYNGSAWKTHLMHAIWSPDRTYFEQAMTATIENRANAAVNQIFGGLGNMKGTLGPYAVSPDSGRAVNIVAPANTLLNAGVRVIIWGEYYE